jgi:hypothetical protein
LLLHRPSESGRLTSRLGSSYRADDTGHQQTGVVAQPNVAGYCRNVDAGGRADFDRTLQLDRSPGQPVEVPDDDAVDAFLCDVVEHAFVLGTPLAGESADVVVDVLVSDVPTTADGEPPAILELTLYAEPLVAGVRGDAGIYDCLDLIHAGTVKHAPVGGVDARLRCVGRDFARQSLVRSITKHRRVHPGSLARTSPLVE